MSAQVLIVEDEPKIARVVADYLERDGFQTRQLHTGNGAAADILATAPDLVILDLNLPGQDGVSIAREVRAQSDVPIIMLTARVDEIDRLLGLEVGADDYVCKPFSPREVVARVRTVLRRAQQTPAAANGSALTFGPIVLDSASHECAVDGSLLDLTPVEFRILQTLMAEPGTVLSRERLMQTSYPDQRLVSSRTIDSHVNNLRRKLVAAGVEAEALRSIYGVGYRLG